MTTVSRETDVATSLVAHAQSLISSAARRLGELGGPEIHQVLAYDLAHLASAVATAQSALKYAELGEEERALASAFIAIALGDLGSRVVGREELFGWDANFFDPFRDFVNRYRSPEFLASVAERPGDRHLDDSFGMVAETFHRFALEKVRPYAEHVHRDNDDVPESVIQGLAELGGFGLSVPEEFGGFASGDESDYLGMVVATEELSWGALGIGGSLITRPEILTRALIDGGTDEQKATWLPQLASGEKLAAVAVTEPDFGSDVASITTTAIAHGDAFLINGTKTWCTFAARADVLMLLARTNPDRSVGRRGLSLFLVEKPIGDGHGFLFNQPDGGRLEGRPIDTLGYRGMHSYEVSFTDWIVPATALVGGEAGLGRGFYLQMAGFENGRIQTAARAIGVMQAAYDAALEYARSRMIFGRPLLDYELTRVKLGTMAAIIQCARQFSYDVARLMARGEGSLEASMAKAYVCRAAEWVTREAMQIHGGMGYAEEFPVSRYFVDARVLSIFEGADETLCLKVIARRLIGE